MIWELNDGIKSKTPFLDIRDKVHTSSLTFPGDETCFKIKKSYFS